MVSKIEPVKQLINQLSKRDQVQLMTELGQPVAVRQADGSDDRYVTKNEAAKILSTSTRTIARYCEAGVLKKYTLGGRVVRLRRSELFGAMKAL